LSTFGNSISHIRGWNRLRVWTRVIISATAAQSFIGSKYRPQGEEQLAFVVHIILTSVLLIIVANVVRGVRIDNWGQALAAALVLGLVNAVVRPVMILLTLPLTVLTFGLFLFVVNAFMLQITATVVPGMKVEGCSSAIWGSLLLSLLNLFVGVLLGVI